MANIARSLATYFSWDSVLTELGVRPPVRVLPAVVPCPICHESRLHGYRDEIEGGQWVRCRGQCGFAGDVIELAAAAWGLGLEAAILRLGASDLPLPADVFAPEAIEDYLEHHVRARRRVNEFWQAAQQKPIADPTSEVRMLLAKLGVGSDQLISPSWPARVGQFLGAASRRAIEDLYHPGSYSLQERLTQTQSTSVRRGSGAGRSRIFRGVGWSDVLVVPAYDLPGRICGFWLLGRELSTEAGDILFRPVRLGGSSRRIKEAGLGMATVMEQKTDAMFGDAVYVVDDPLIALRLQIRWSRNSNFPLPLVLCRSDTRAQTGPVWRQLPPRPFIFVGQDPHMFKLAKSAGGLVSSYKISDAEMAYNQKHKQPHVWLHAFRKKAVRWHTALQRQLQRCDLTKGEDILVQIDFQPEEFRRFLSGCPRELAERIERMSPQRIRHRWVKVAGQTIVENEAGWQRYPSGESISNGAIHLEKIVRTTDDRHYYQGVVRLQGSNLPYTVSKADVDRHGLFRPVAEELLDKHHAVMSYQPSWAKRAEYIAQQLHQPEHITGLDRIGWNADLLRFVFPKFSIALGGEVCADSLPLVTDPPVPGEHLCSPESLYLSDRKALSGQTPEVQLGWALAATIIHNILTGLFAHAPRGILLDGPCAQITGRKVAAALGCPQVAINRLRFPNAVIDQINRACCRHGWPTILLPSGSQKLAVSAEWYDEPGPKNAIVGLNSYATNALLTQANFHVIRHRGEPRALGALRQSLSKLISNFLVDLCRRKVEIEQRADTYVQSILRDLAGWFGRQGGDPKAVLRAEQVLVPAGSVPAWSVFIDIVCQLIDSGELEVAREGWQPVHGRSDRLILCDPEGTTGDSVWIPQRAVNRRLVEHRAMPVEAGTITESLRHDEIEVRIESLRGEPGWLVPGPWCSEQYARWKAAEGQPTARSVVRSGPARKPRPK
ncbi:hypothetical protein ACFL5Q_02260 [Planctomycetota bacterium]